LHYCFTDTRDTIESLAEEAVLSGADETVQWTLPDHLNTVRDIAKYDSGSDMTTVVNHLIYDAFGKVTSESNPAVDSLFHFTARPFDEDTQLQNNLNRWYDTPVGRWLSEDPIGFDAGDGNLYRYVGNATVTSVDPTGQACLVFYICFYVSQQRLDWNTVRCLYRCTIDTTKGGEHGDPPGTRTYGVGIVDCRDPRLAFHRNISDYRNKFDLVGECDCPKTLRSSKLFDEWSNPFRDCSRAECKRQAAENIRAFEQTCRLLPPGPQRSMCQAAAKAEREVLNEMCDECSKP